MKLGDAALALAFRDWPVFPLEPKGKRPIVKGGFKAATTDAEQIRKWWAATPNANIGFATGSTVVVEIDGPTGLASMNALKVTHEWPVTLTAMSGRVGGGAHFFFAAGGEEIRNAAGVRPNGRGLGEGIDVRGAGGYVVLPPSIHPSARRYRWAVREAVQPLPPWMAEKLRPPTYTPAEPADTPNSTRYVQAAWERELEAVRTAPDGRLNVTLNEAAYALGRFVARGDLAEEETFDALYEAAVAAGHPPRGAANTVKSGLSSGMRRG